MKQSKTPALQRLLTIARHHQSILTVSVALIIYVGLVSWQAYRQRDQINPDAVCYIRNAQYLTEGRFADSVSGHWAPLISWCMAPFVYFGMDGLYTARVVLGVWGGVFVLASFVFMQRFARCTVWLQLAALSLIAIFTVREATHVIAPDLPLFTLLMGYCAVVVSPKLLEQKRLQVLSGLLGGMAYLAKYYALPFFLVHFTFIVALQWWVRRSKTSLRRTALSWGTGVLLFLVVSAPWIGLLSWKYHKPTFSISARMAHAFVGPKDVTDSLTMGMYDLPPGRIFSGETPEVMGNDVYWSPFQKWDYAKHQIKLTVRHSKRILNDIRNFDELGICLPALIFIPIVMWKPASTMGWFRSVWVLGTVLIYCSGFTLVYYEVRYIRGFLWPMCCIYCLGFLVPSFAKLAVKASLPRWSAWVVAALVVASFAERVRKPALPYYLSHDRASRGASYRMVAQELRSAGFRGPFAADELHPHLGYYVAFHLNEPFLGSPVEKTKSEIEAGTPIEMTVPEIEAVLEEYGVQSFLIHSDWALVDAFGEKTSWQLKQELPYDSGTLYVYVSPRQSEIQHDESRPGMPQDE